MIIGEFAFALAIILGFALLITITTILLEPRDIDAEYNRAKAFNKAKANFAYKEKYAELTKETNRAEIFRTVA